MAINLGNVVGLLRSETPPDKKYVVWAKILNPSFPDLVELHYWDQNTLAWTPITDPTTQYWLRPVLDDETTAPPSAPTEGDRYLIPTGATGVWASNVDKVTTWRNSAWVYQTPLDGYIVSVRTKANQLYDYRGIYGAGGAWFVNDFQVPVSPGDYIPSTDKGAALGVATLNSSTKVPASQIDGATLPFTPANAPSWPGGTVTVKAALDYLITALGNSGVSSFNGRQGAVAPANSDYTAAQITNVAGGGIISTNVQGAINELDGEVSARELLFGVFTESTTNKNAAVGDRNRKIKFTNAGANTLTVNGSLPTGYIIFVERATGAGIVSLAGHTSLSPAGANVQQFDKAVAYVHEGSNAWKAYGPHGAAPNYLSSPLPVNTDFDVNSKKLNFTKIDEFGISNIDNSLDLLRAYGTLGAEYIQLNVPLGLGQVNSLTGLPAPEDNYGRIVFDTAGLVGRIGYSNGIFWTFVGKDQVYAQFDTDEEFSNTGTVPNLMASVAVNSFIGTPLKRWDEIEVDCTFVVNTNVTDITARVGRTGDPVNATDVFTVNLNNRPGSYQLNLRIKIPVVDDIKVKVGASFLGGDSSQTTLYKYTEITDAEAADYNDNSFGFELIGQSTASNSITLKALSVFIRRS